MSTNYKGYTSARPIEFEDGPREVEQMLMARHAAEEEYRESRMPELIARAERGEPLFDTPRKEN